MPKNTKIELVKDDEILREQGMTSGPAKAARWELRTTAATEVSWMQRNKVLQPEMDILWRACAFAYIHEAPRVEIRKVINDHDTFIEAVDRWMDKNDPTSADIKELVSMMNTRIEEWFASSSEHQDATASSGN
ncbi:MAG: hypothetical protein RLZ22_157 [Verrucomicrobiota bacterium]|jgi:hypothetical protein